MNLYDTKRFWNKVDIRNFEDCWNWQGSFKSKGYGQFYLNDKNKSSHRIAYELSYGQIPHGKFICHKCDNKKCCNPLHLFVDSHRGNMDDMVNKRRYHGGEKTHLSKLTEADVINILDGILESKYINEQQILNRYSMSRYSINRILKRQTWKHVTDNYSDCELKYMRQTIYKRKFKMD